ncbi:MAG: aldo/keto reductase [Acidothermus sp.]|nr:aldo/keto reductase [Acidothermus sp.]
MAEMTYRQLGNSGLTVSTVGLGCNNIGRRLDVDATAAVVDAALDVGITFFDAADVYGSSPGACEEILGEVLRGRREHVILATKFGKPMRGAIFPESLARGSRRYIRAAVEGSLRRLQTDYIDLYQMHEPDPRTPIEETLEALDELVSEGKVRYVGSSNFAAWQVVDADWVARSAGLERFISAQNEYNLLNRDVERELVPACEHLGIGVLPYYPLASGLLTGKYRRDETPRTGRLSEPTQQARLAAAPWDVIEALSRFAAERGLSLLDVAIGGLAAQPGVASVIAGATSPEQVKANAHACKWEPTAADLQELDRITGQAGERH